MGPRAALHGGNLPAEEPLGDYRARGPDPRHFPVHLLADSLRPVLESTIRGETVPFSCPHGIVFHLFFSDGRLRSEQGDPVVPRAASLPTASTRTGGDIPGLFHQHPDRPGRARALHPPPFPHPTGTDHQHGGPSDSPRNDQPHPFLNGGFALLSGRHSAGAPGLAPFPGGSLAARHGTRTR